MNLELHVAGLGVRVRSEAPAVLAALEVLWRPARDVVADPDLEIQVAADGQLRWQGTILVEGGGAFERIPDVSGLIIEEVTEQNRDAVLLHAAAVVLDGRLFVFVGESCAGKSSFTREALRAGASYIADDFLVLRGQRLRGIGRAVQFDFCEEDHVPSYFLDCRLVPFPASVAGGVSPVVPVWDQAYVALDGFDVPTEGAVVVLLRHAEGDEAEQLAPLDSLARLAALHAASLTVGQTYDGGLGYGPSFELCWRDPATAFALLLDDVRGR